MTLTFIKLQQIMQKYSNGQDVILYLDNDTKIKNKFGKLNYRILRIGNINMVDNKFKYTNCEFDDKLLIALRDSLKDEQFMKIFIHKDPKEFQDKVYYEYQFKKVEDNEILKLKLLDRKKWFEAKDDNMEKTTDITQFLSAHEIELMSFLQAFFLSEFQKAFIFKVVINKLVDQQQLLKIQFQKNFENLQILQKK